MKNTLENKQLSFEDILGNDIKFFNKDVDTKGSFKDREKALEHDEDCDCMDCFKDSLMR